jgi:hypothetical protein
MPTFPDLFPSADKPARRPGSGAGALSALINLFRGPELIPGGL